MGKNLKIFLGVSYLILLFLFLYFIFTAIEIKRLDDFTYYKELQSDLGTFISANILINIFYITKIFIILIHQTYYLIEI